jgi:hypothetical protein
LLFPIPVLPELGVPELGLLALELPGLEVPGLPMLPGVTRVGAVPCATIRQPEKADRAFEARAGTSTCAAWG